MFDATHPLPILHSTFQRKVLDSTVAAFEAHVADVALSGSSINLARIELHIYTYIGYPEACGPSYGGVCTLKSLWF